MAQERPIGGTTLIHKPWPTHIGHQARNCIWLGQRSVEGIANHTPSPARPASPQSSVGVLGVRCPVLMVASLSPFRGGVGVELPRQRWLYGNTPARLKARDGCDHPQKNRRIGGGWPPIARKLARSLPGWGMWGKKACPLQIAISDKRSKKPTSGERSFHALGQPRCQAGHAVLRRTDPPRRSDPAKAKSPEPCGAPAISIRSEMLGLIAP